VITATHPTTPSINGQSPAFEVQALRVTNLDTGERFWTIQAAIDDADTLGGHAISITAGVYTESVTLHKAVKLIGAGSGPGGTVIAQTLAGPAIARSGWCRS
jgi:pectin methylesterase-like acyl-CoA thioesterase